MILFKLIEELKSEKYVFAFICIFIILIYNVYRNVRSCKNNIEKMTQLSDNRIAEAVKHYYLSDDFLRTMTDTSIKIRTEGLKLIGNLSVRGNIKASNDIMNNQFSLTSINNNINNKIGAIQRQQEILRQQQFAEAERRRQQEQAEAERRRQEEIRRQEEQRRQAAEAERQRQVAEALRRQQQERAEAERRRQAHEHWLNTRCGAGRRRADRCSSGCERPKRWWERCHGWGCCT